MPAVFTQKQQCPLASHRGQRRVVCPSQNQPTRCISRSPLAGWALLISPPAYSRRSGASRRPQLAWGSAGCACSAPPSTAYPAAWAAGPPCAPCDVQPRRAAATAARLRARHALVHRGNEGTRQQTSKVCANKLPRWALRPALPARGLILPYSPTTRAGWKALLLHARPKRTTLHVRHR